MPKWTPLVRHFLLHLVNNLAIGNYDKCCAIRDIAKRLGKTEGRIKRLAGRWSSRATCSSKTEC